jgi:hypothetical protein
LLRISLILLISILIAISCKKEPEPVEQQTYLVSIGDYGITKERFVPEYRVTSEFRKAELIDTAMVNKYFRTHYLSNLYLVAKASEEGIDQKPEFKRVIHERRVSQLTHIDGPLYRKLIPGNFEMSESELYDLYEKVKYGYKVSHIKVATRELADSLYQALENGADFGELAQVYSLDMRSAMYKGIINWFFSYGTFARSFEEAVENLSMGQLSEPVETNTGYHLIMLIERKENQLDPFNKIRHLLEDRLQQIKKTEFIQDYINGLFETYPYQVDKDAARELLKITRVRRENGLLALDKGDEALGNKTLITFEGPSISIKDFIQKFNALPRVERIYITRMENLEWIIQSLMVQELMYLDALKYKLHEDKIFKQKLHTFKFARMVEFANQEFIQSKIEINDEEVREYFDQNKDKWKNQTFEKVEKFVRYRVKENKANKIKKDVLAELYTKFEPVFNDVEIQNSITELNRYKQIAVQDTTQKNRP